MITRYRARGTVITGLMASIVFSVFVYFSAPLPEFMISLRVVNCLAIFIFTGWGYAVVTLSGYLESQWKVGNDKIDNVTTTFLRQGQIDLVLQELAERFDRACNAQILLSGELNSSEQLYTHTWVIRETKSKFWSAHALAKELGFSVHDEYKSYLGKRVVQG